MSTLSQPQSNRVCSDPIGNTTPGAIYDSKVKGCDVCHNQDRYGYGRSVCGRCERCHGCGSSNNGIGPLQAVYFGVKSVVKHVGKAGRKDKDSGGKDSEVKA